jgi:hypothetical protein
MPDDDVPAVTTDDLLATLNDRAGEAVTVTVRFLDETPLAMLTGVLRTDFDVAREAGPDYASIAAEPPMGDTDPLAVYHVGDGAFAVPNADALTITALDDGIYRGVSFRDPMTPVETVVEWRDA